VGYDDTPTGEFLDAIASGRAEPAGGTAAAFAEATGAALCEMVCVHTVDAEPGLSDGAASDDGHAGPAGRDDGTDADFEGFDALRTGLRRRRRTLVALGNRDAEVVEALFGDGGRPSTRLRRRAAGIPLAVSEAALGVLTDAEPAYDRGRDGVHADALPDRSFAAAVERSAATVRGRVLGADG
jgi:formiminotetrahydrofolate cyclodeaminase